MFFQSYGCCISLGAKRNWVVDTDEAIILIHIFQSPPHRSSCEQGGCLCVQFVSIYKMEEIKKSCIVASTSGGSYPESLYATMNRTIICNGLVEFAPFEES